MSVDVWFRRDIAQALAAAYHNARETQFALGVDDARFNAGIRTITTTLAIAFGISPDLVIPAGPSRLTGGE